MKLHIGSTTSGKDFLLPIDLVTQSVAILAKRGVGKTYTAAVFAEELMNAHQTPIIIDPTGAHWGLKSSADGKKAGYPVYVFGGDHGDLPLEDTSGEVIARTLVENPFPAVIDLSLFRKGQATRFLCAFFETLYRLNRTPLHLICDEADVYAPQKPFAEEARTLGAMEDIVRRGRIRGIGCTLITQRPAVLNKNVLTQCEMLVAMRLVHPKDIDAIEEWVAVHGDSLTATTMIHDLPSLPIGTAWIWSPGWGDIFERVKIRARTTFDSSATPKPGQQIVKPKEFAQVDLDKLGKEILSTVERAKADDPKALKARIAQLERDAKTAKPAPAVKVEVREVPVLLEAHGHKLVHMVTLTKQMNKKGAKIMAELDKLNQEIFARIESSRKILRTATPAPLSVPTVVIQRREYVPTPRGKNDDGLPEGERKVLTALADHGKGLERNQLTVLTGYKRSTRDKYLQYLGQKAYVTIGMRGNIIATEAGIAALGPDYQPLPTGTALREHYLRILPDGERNILGVLISRYPDAVARETIDEVTGLKRSTRDKYLQYLASRELVVSTREGVTASANLF